MDRTDARVATMDDRTLYNEAHQAEEWNAHSSVGEKIFLWVAWALAAAFIGFTMSLYLPNFMA